MVLESTSAARLEKTKLRRDFARIDVFLFLICTLVGLDTIGSVAKNGAQGFTWLVFLGVAFFIPYGLLIAELGSTFTDEGGPYTWVRLAFGRLPAAISVLMYWASNPIWLGGSLAITAITAFSAFFFPLNLTGKYCFGLFFIWVSIIAAIAPVRVGKWLPAIGAWSRVVVLALFTASVALYARRHGLHGFGGHDFLPDYAGFITVAPVLVFNYVGFELPSAAGEEMRDPRRDVPYAILRSMIGTVLLYGVPVLAILLVLPRDTVTSLSGFVDAIKAVFSIYGGHVDAKGAATLAGWGLVTGRIAALAFILALVSSGATWIMGADRVVAVAAIDGSAPRWLGKFSERYGTPVAVNILSGVLSSAVLVLTFWLTAGDSGLYFSAVLGLAISTTTLSYLAIFPCLVALQRRFPTLERAYQVPGGRAGAWICSVVTTAWAFLATVGLIWPGLGIGWFGSSGDPDKSLPAGFEHLRTTYELTQLIPLIFLLIIGVLFYVSGRDTRETEGNG